MSYDPTQLVNIHIPKTRNESDATYDYTGFSRSVNTLTTEPYWAWGGWITSVGAAIYVILDLKGII